MRKVYITGIGILSRIGTGYQEHKQIFEEYGTNIANLNWENDGLFPGNYGSIKNFVPKKYINNKKSIKFMSRQCMLGCSASSLAAKNAGIDQNESEKKSYNTALVYGSSVCDSILPLKEAIKLCLNTDGSINYLKLANDGILNLPPLWILTSLPNTTAGQIAIQHSIRGVNFSLVNGPTGGLAAIGEAFRMIRSNRAKRVFCGGAEGGIYSDYMNRLANEGITDRATNVPNCYCVGTSGGLIGEGAAVLIIENNEILKERECEPHAKILGYYNGYIPEFKDMKPADISSHYAKCMRRALADAGIKADMVSMVQGSGFGYKKIDKAEAKAVEVLFKSRVPYTCSNGIFGFTLGASGGMSLVAAIIQMESQQLIPIKADRELYFENDINYVTSVKPSRSIDIAIINCFDQYGCMNSVVIKKMGA